MSLYSKALFASDHVVKEYILVLKDESLKLFLDDVSLRSIGTKTNCYIELTNRILNRRVNSFKLIKYAIIKIIGSDESAIRQCNRLLENQFPLYRHRKEYQKRTECCTLFSQEFIPDNSSLYFPFQRTGGTTYHFGDVLIKSPYQPTVLRSNNSCQWRMGDADLLKGITITQHKQVETYLSYHFRKSSTEQEPFDPKAPIRYVSDDYSKGSVNRSGSKRKEYDTEARNALTEAVYGIQRHHEANVCTSQFSRPSKNRVNKPMSLKEKHAIVNSLVKEGSEKMSTNVGASLFNDCLELFVENFFENDKIGQDFITSNSKKSVIPKLDKFCEIVYEDVVNDLFEIEIEHLVDNSKHFIVKNSVVGIQSTIINKTIDNNITTKVKSIVNLLNSNLGTEVGTFEEAIPTTDDIITNFTQSIASKEHYNPHLVPHIRIISGTSCRVSQEKLKESLKNMCRRISKEPLPDRLKRIDSANEQNITGWVPDEEVNNFVCLTPIVTQDKTSMASVVKQIESDLEETSADNFPIVEDIFDEEEKLDKLADSSSDPIYQYLPIEVLDEIVRSLSERSIISHLKDIDALLDDEVPIVHLQPNVEDNSEDVFSNCFSFKISSESSFNEIIRTSFTDLISEGSMKLEGIINEKDVLYKLQDDGINEAIEVNSLNWILEETYETILNDHFPVEIKPKNGDSLNSINKTISHDLLSYTPQEVDFKEEELHKVIEDNITSFIIDDICECWSNCYLGFENKAKDFEALTYSAEITNQNLPEIITEESMRSECVVYEIEVQGIKNAKIDDNINVITKVEISSPFIEESYDEVDENLTLADSSKDSSIQNGHLINLCADKIMERAPSEILSLENEAIFYICDPNITRVDDSVPKASENIQESITDILYRDATNKCENEMLSESCLQEPTKNPSATLIDAGALPHLSRKQSNLTIKISTSLKVEQKSIQKKESKGSFLRKLDKKVLSSQNDVKNSEDDRIKQIIKSGSGIVSENVTARSSSKPKFQKNSNRITPARESFPVICESKDTLNIISSNIWEGHANQNEEVKVTSKAVKCNVTTGSGLTNLEENFQVINIDLDNDTNSEIVDFESIDGGFGICANLCSQPIVNIESDVKYKKVDFDLKLEPNLQSSTTQNSFRITSNVPMNSEIRNDSLRSIKMEDTQELTFTVINGQRKWSKITVAVPKGIETQSIRTSSQENSQIRQEIVVPCTDVILPANVTIEDVCTKIQIRPTAEAWIIVDSELNAVFLNDVPVHNACLFIETSGELNVLIQHDDHSPAIFKFCEVFSSRISNIESMMSGRSSSCIQKAVYTTVSVDDDDSEFEESNKDSVVLSTIGEGISSMIYENGRITGMEDGDRSDHYAVDREKIILIVNNDGGQPINVLRLNQLRNMSPVDSKTDTGLRGSTTTPTQMKTINHMELLNDSSHKHGLRSILHSKGAKTKHMHYNSKTASFDNCYDCDSLLGVVAPQRNVNGAPNAKQPKVKRTLLDLSKEVKTRALQGQIISNEMICNSSPEKSLKNTSVEHLVVSSNSQSNSTPIDEFLSSNNDSSKDSRKSRARTLSDKIIFKAKQFISKFNLTKKNSNGYSDSNTSSLSLDNLNRTYVISDHASKSSIDSYLSRNSLARYWNIQKFDSIKRLKVKERSLSYRPPENDYFSHY